MATASYTLTVASDHGDPDPAVGITTYDDHTQISCKVTSPVTEGVKVWACTGWTGTGSVPAKGQGKTVTFPLTEDSTITWSWTQIAWYHGTVGAQVVTAISFALVVILAALSYISQHALMTAVWAGAVGGIIHEIAQSQGTFVLPNIDDKGSLCLGGLFGLIGGGIAGLALYGGLNATKGAPLIGQLFVEAILAGLAFKGVADAINPPSSNQSSATS